MSRQTIALLSIVYLYVCLLVIVKGEEEGVLVAGALRGQKVQPDCLLSGAIWYTWRSTQTYIAVRERMLRGG